MTISTHAGAPIQVRSSGVALSESTQSWIQARAGRQLGKFGGRVQRVTLRFKDVNGPRGGKDMLCRAKVTLKGLPSVVVEQRAKTARKAFDLVAPSAGRAVQKAIDRAPASGAGKGGFTPAPKRTSSAARGSSQRTTALARNPKGSLIGRRVGQGKKNLLRAADRPEKRRRDVPVDTSLPGVSASMRKVGAQSTATRNTKLNRRGMTAALEDSAAERPSRKSTRRSQNRAKSGSKLSRRETRRVTSPQSRARRASARSARMR
jgi:hypothetical protein